MTVAAEQRKDIQLNALDWISAALYFVLLCFLSHRIRLAGKQLENKDLNWFGVAVSLFASNIGAEYFVGLAGAAASFGFAVGWFELGSVLCFLVLGFIILPVFIRSKATSMSEYIEMRYGRRCQISVSILTLVIYVLSKISVSFLAWNLLFEELFPRSANVWVVTGAHITLSVLYTSVSGCRWIIFNEALLITSLLCGAAVLMAFSLESVDGIAEVTEASKVLSNSTEFNLKLFRKWNDPVQPWPAAISGFYVFALWFWALDQNVVRRAMTAQDVNHGTIACLCVALLKLLPFFAMVIPGVCGRILLERLLQGNNNADEEVKNVLMHTDRMYAFLLRQVVPCGVRGIIIVSLLGGSVSSLASVLNSSLELVVSQIIFKLRPQTPKYMLQQMGKWCMAGMVLVSVLWLRVLMSMPFSQLFLLMQTPTAIFAPPITVICLGGMLSSIPTEHGAERALLAGAVIGTLRFLLEISNQVHGTRGGWFAAMHFMYFAALQSLISVVILFLTSNNADQRCKVEEDYMWDLNIRRDIMQPQFRYAAMVLQVNSELELEPVWKQRESDDDEDDIREQDEEELIQEDCYVCTRRCRLCAIRQPRVETFIKLFSMFVLMRWLSLVMLLQFGMQMVLPELSKHNKTQI